MRRSDLLRRWSHFSERGWWTRRVTNSTNDNDATRAKLRELENHLRQRIRGQDHTVVQAINRQLAHYAYHAGQIVYLAKHFRSSEWQTLSVPKNKSAEFNARMSVRSPRLSKG